MYAKLDGVPRRRQSPRYCCVLHALRGLLQKGWASLSILMCRKQEHGKDRPKPAEVRKFLEKYLGKIDTAIADNKLSYAVNFNYQAFSVSDYLFRRA